MLQVVIAAGDDEAMLPTSIDKISVSVDLPRGAGSKFRGYAHAQKTSPREATAQVVMFDDELRQPAIVINGLHFRSFAEPADGSGIGFLPTHRNLCSEIVWKKDVDLTALV